jgi:MOSC domain-containing protein YiiM
MTAQLVSVNVGMPKDVPWRGKTVHTGIWKNPVDGPVMVRRLNIDGDGQGDLAGHGGEQRAVMVYQTESYDYWRDYLGRDDLQPGQFGENLTVTGLDDRSVCIGDRYRIGDAEFEVTPRSSRSTPLSRTAVESATRIWPPWPAAMTRAARLSTVPK